MPISCAMHCFRFGELLLNKKKVPALKGLTFYSLREIVIYKLKICKYISQLQVVITAVEKKEGGGMDRDKMLLHLGVTEVIFEEVTCW